ncbi:hypothetical protein E8E14_004610 [Neopestalotiopsis sp. 37M]|nr:hypothetical protein E8E14_004610 [Neopestalotiopsis sp. 37M]
MFCPGISLDTEGRPIVSGGVSDTKVSAYDEITGNWSPLRNMTVGRGYHAQVTLSNGDLFTIGGSWSGGIGGDGVPRKVGEVFKAANGTWKPLPGCLVEPMLTNDTRGAFCSDNHAWLFAWRNESVFQAGPSSAINWYDTHGSGNHYSAGLRGSDLDSMNGNAVMFDAVQGKILTLGGSTSYTESYSTGAAHIITLSGPYKHVVVENIGSMHYPRAYANSVILPTGEVFINGGVSYAKQWDDFNSSLVPEIWNPATHEFAKAAKSPIPRNYHSTAILLPDATVLTGGGGLCWKDCDDSSVNHVDAQVYYPPYLFDSRGKVIRSRPQILDVSSFTVQPGAILVVTTNLPIIHFTLIRYSSVTHSVNTDQRRIPLSADPAEIQQSRKHQWRSNLLVPDDLGVITPGYWMLFAISDQGVPSHAATIHVPLEEESKETNHESHPPTDFSAKAPAKSSQTIGEGSNVSLRVRQSHPRLFATVEEWAMLPSTIATDPYRTQWNQTIAMQSENWRDQAPTPYGLVGPLNGNGVLDTARQIQLYIKHWAYMYRMTLDTKWKNRIWEELVMAAGNSTEYFGLAGDNWNSQHWLDTGEFLVAFSIAYDWLYEAWTIEQRKAIMWSIISLGLVKALEAYDDDAWFLHVESNWNCVTNGGVIIAALAIYHEDPIGIAQSLLPRAMDNARDYCAQAVQTDGTWKETPDYWYFGVQAHAQLSSALLTASGETHGLLHANQGMKKTGMFHIYNTGFAGKFDYGDCGPAKITATANALFFYGKQYRIPAYVKFQRDRVEAADPLSMFWYETPSDDAMWWSDLPLDRSFDDENGAWVSMRSSWTSSDGLFVAMKAGELVGHSSHGNLDAGDFVLDALGERWAVELCHQDYLSPGYFDSEAQDSKRWQYYRTGTAGQNTILYNGTNQLVAATPNTSFEAIHASDHDFRADYDYADTFVWTANLTSAYDGPQVQRALRLLHNRTQVLIQDHISKAVHASQWRMHTSADIQVSEDRRQAGKSFVTLAIPTPLIVCSLDDW